MPSIAITKPNMNHEGYGEITVIFGKETMTLKKLQKTRYGLVISGLQHSHRLNMKLM